VRTGCAPYACLMHHPNGTVDGPAVHAFNQHPLDPYCAHPVRTPCAPRINYCNGWLRK
jgi:hypothetical protein